MSRNLANIRIPVGMVQALEMINRTVATKYILVLIFKYGLEDVVLFYISPFYMHCTMHMHSKGIYKLAGSSVGSLILWEKIVHKSATTRRRNTALALVIYHI